MTSLLPTHPDYPLYDDLWRLYAMALNPQCWGGTNEMRAWDFGIAPEDLLVTLEEMMTELLDGLPAEFVMWKG